MKPAVKAAVVGALALGALSFGATAASAEIVCNSDNVCWHVHDHYDYHPEWGLAVHQNDWKAGPQDHYTWRDHEGRGYWRNNAWVTF